MPTHLQIGNTVEMVEGIGHTFVEATIVDISSSDGMTLIKPTHDISGGNDILVDKEKLRPLQASSPDREHDGMGHHPNFIIYTRVDVLVRGKWRTGIIVQSPTSIVNRYHVRIFREKEKSDFTVTVTTKMRIHMVWNRLRGWNYHSYESNRHPLNQAVGLVGHQRAKILRMLDSDHAIVEFSDLKKLDGTHVQEVILMKDWYKSRWERGLKNLRCWLAPSDDPLREFECYMPVYTCLAMFAVVSQVLFSNSAENWPDDMLLIFYLLGGLCCSLSLLPAVGVMCRQPTTRAGLRIWRLLCLTCVVISAIFLTIHAVYGRQALAASRAKARKVMSAITNAG